MHEYQKDVFTITIGTSPDCEAKVCTVGSLKMEYMENPSIYFNRDNQQMTRQVALGHHINGFYTHGFAMADYWPANIQWRDQEVLYTLNWSGVEDQKLFVQMAKSVIAQLHNK